MKTINRISGYDFFQISLRIYTGPDPFRAGSASVYMEPFGTDPVLSNTRPVKQQVQFWIRSGPFPKGSRVNGRPILFDFWTESV